MINICFFIGHQIIKLVDDTPRKSGRIFHYECKRCAKNLDGTLT
jgi:hypothetical protein